MVATYQILLRLVGTSNGVQYAFPMEVKTMDFRRDMRYSHALISRFLCICGFCQGTVSLWLKRSTSTLAQGSNKRKSPPTQPIAFLLRLTDTQARVGRSISELGR